MAIVITHPLTSRDVANVLQLSSERIRQLDGELRPIRLPSGHRRYAVADVQRFAEKRSAMRGAK